MIPKTLVQSIAAAMVLVAGSTSAAVPNNGASALSTTMSVAAQRGVDAQAADYFIVFHEAGVMSYDGGIASVASTKAARSGGPLQVRDSSVVAYRDYLANQRRGYLQALAAQVSDPAVLAQLAKPAFVYDIVFHGIALEGLTAAQAAALRNAPGVKEVTLAPVYELDTDRVETFVGAGGIWSGANTPANVASRGQGGTIAVIDTGLTSSHATHGSFLNDTTCGFSAATPKVVSALDCTTGTACAGPSPYSVNNPHGTHTAATVGGNDHVATGGDLVGKRVSGVAPCAQVFSLKGCATTSCAGAATAAAAQKILEMQADYNITAVNYSIGGGTSPWNTGDINRAFLDMVDAGIFVAASAGNTRAETPNPIALVSHRGPWVTTVANSTHDRVSSNNVDTDLGGPTAQYGLKGGMAFPSTDVVATLVAPAAANPLGCDPHGSGALSGKILLVSRGSCSFEIKMNQASAAGASGVIVVNNTQSPFPIAMGATENATIPGVMVSGPVGAAIAAHLSANPTTKATIRAQTSYLTSPTLGDVLADSSLRGPVPASLEITKPDITAPGTNIFAAYDSGTNSYDYMSGTSMSGPHVAGAGALIKSVHPNWTPMEVRSALMMTAKRVGLKDFINGTPNTGNWDADDVGSGRLDLTKAAKATLVMNETKTKFLAASGNTANQRALNMPSMRNVVCTPNCTFTRTVRNTSTTAKTWVATTNGDGKLSISVSPASFSFTGDITETKELTITVTPVGDQTASMAFGHVLLNSAGSPEQHMTVSAKGNGPVSAPTIKVTPESLSGTANEGDTAPVSRPLNIANIGTAGQLTWQRETTLSQQPISSVSAVLVDQPASGTSGIVSSWSTTENGGAYTSGDFTLNVSANLETLTVYGFNNASSVAPPKVRWFIYADAGGSAAGNPDTGGGAAPLWTQELNGTAAGVSYTGGEIKLDLAAAGLTSVNLSPGIYWLSVAGVYDNPIGPAGSSRWNWFGADQVGGPSKLVGGMFGISEWTPTGTGGLASAVEDVAMTITGTLGAIDCNASWISMSPTSGTVNAGQSDDVVVQLDPTGLAAGIHIGNVCLSSNDAVNPEVVIPVSFDVQGEVIIEEADLALTMVATPNPVEQGNVFTVLANVVNFGSSMAGDVTVTMDLPTGMDLDSLVYVVADTADLSSMRATSSAGRDALVPTAGTWACAPVSAQVVCSFDEPLPASSIAPALQVTVMVPAATEPGSYPLTGTTASNKTDPVLANNTVNLDIEVTGLSDLIFADGFDPASDPDIVTGTVDQLVVADADGSTLDFVTGQWGVYNGGRIDDINLYDYGTGLNVYWYGDALTLDVGGVVDGSGEFEVLQSGAVIGPASTISATSKALVNWHSTQDGYLGVAFENEETGQLNYGYIHMTTSGPLGHPARVLEYSYNKTGAAITIP